MKKLISRLSNFTRAIGIICALTIIASILTLTFAYEEYEPLTYAELGLEEFSTPLPILSDGEVNGVGTKSTMAYELIEEAEHNENAMESVSVDDKSFMHAIENGNSFIEEDDIFLNEENGNYSFEIDEHCCGELYSHDGWECPICDEEDCECWLEYCMLCTELNEDCECEFVGINPMGARDDHVTIYFCPGRGATWNNSILGAPLPPNTRANAWHNNFRGNLVGGQGWFGTCGDHEIRRMAHYSCWWRTSSSPRITNPCDKQQWMDIRPGFSFSHWELALSAPTTVGIYGYVWCARWTYTCNFNIPATCTQPARCSHPGCGGTSGNALGHAHRTATCTLNNACTRCDLVTQNALGHAHRTASCTQNNACQRAGCGHVTIQARQHSWGAWTVPGTSSAQPITTQPVGANAGVQRRTCLHNATATHSNCTTTTTRSVWNVTYDLTILHNDVNATFTHTDGGELTQIIGQDDNAVAPIVTAESFCCCGRRIWQGWDNDGQGITSARTIIPDAPVIRTHTVTFVLENDGLAGTHSGDVSLTQDIEHTLTAALPEVIHPYGHRFVRWGTTGNEHIGITEPTTIVAQYVPKSYYVIFLNYDSTEHDRQQVYFGNSGELPEMNPEKYGHTFHSWDVDDFTITIAEKLFVNAVFNINRYKVEFFDWNGVKLFEVVVSHGSSVLAPITPERSGYTFSGWEGDLNYISSDTTVTATYAPIPPVIPEAEDDISNGEDTSGSEGNSGSGEGGSGDTGGAGNNTENGGNSGGSVGSGSSENDSEAIEETQPAGENSEVDMSYGIAGQLRGREESYFLRDQGIPEAHFGLGSTELNDTDNNSQGVAPFFTFMGRDIFLFADFSIASWALVNLLFIVFGVLLTAKNTILAIKRKRSITSCQIPVEGEFAVDRFDKSIKWFVTGTILSGVSIVLFLLTQDMSALTALLDYWTIAHMALLIAQVVIYKAFRNSHIRNDTQENATEVTEVTEVLDDETIVEAQNY